MGDDEDGVEEQEIDNNPSFEKRFGWYAVLNRIASDDITKHETIYKKKMVEVLNQVVYLVAKDNEIIKQQKKLQNK